QCLRDVRTNIINIVRNGTDNQYGKASPAQILLVRNVLINRNQYVEAFFRFEEKLSIFFAGKPGLARRWAFIFRIFTSAPNSHRQERKWARSAFARAAIAWPGKRRSLPRAGACPALSRSPSSSAAGRSVRPAGCDSRAASGEVLPSPSLA